MGEQFCGLRVVVDTHLLASAAQASLEKRPHDASAAESLRLFEEILRICSRVVLAVPQQRETWGNAPARLRGAGHRLQIGASPVLAALEAKVKLLRPAASVIPRLSQQDRKPLRGKGHKRKITDDAHLYETVAQYDGILITQLGRSGPKHPPGAGGHPLPHRPSPALASSLRSRPQTAGTAGTYPQ